MYFAPCPARLGHSGLVVFVPVMPLHAPPAAALLAPASAEPSARADRLRPRPARTSRRDTLMLEAPLGEVLLPGRSAAASGELYTTLKDLSPLAGTPCPPIRTPAFC